MKSALRNDLERLRQAPAEDRPHAMVHLLARVVGVGVETADMLVQEVLSRNLRDRKAVARYAGLTGSPDESGTKRVPVDVKVGDTVVYSKYGGTEITIEGEDLLILNARDVLAIVG